MISNYILREPYPSEAEIFMRVLDKMKFIPHALDKKSPR